MDVCDGFDCESPWSVAIGVDELPLSGSETSSSSSDHSPPGKKSKTGVPDYGSDFEFTEEEESEMPPRYKLCSELLRNQPPPTGEPIKYRHMSRKEFRAYLKQVDRSDGFDIKPLDNVSFAAMIHPACTSEDSLAEIILCAKAAVKHENKRRRKYNQKKVTKLHELRLVGIVKAMCQYSLATSYYLTLKVEEIIDGKEVVEKTYQAKIWLQEPPGITKFPIFRMEGHSGKYEGSDFSDSESHPVESDPYYDSDFDFDDNNDIPVKILCKELLEKYKNHVDDEVEDEDLEDDAESGDEDIEEKDENDDSEDDVESGEEDTEEEDAESEDEYKAEDEKPPCQSLTEEEMEEYEEQVKSTGGFDVKLYPHHCEHGFIQPVRTYESDLENLIRYAKAAVKYENKRRDKDIDRRAKKLKLTGIVKAMSQCYCTTTNYYITLKAEEVDGEEKSSEVDNESGTKIYEALVCSHIPPLKTEFSLFREQGAGAEQACNC